LELLTEARVQQQDGADATLFKDYVLFAPKRTTASGTTLLSGHCFDFPNSFGASS